MTFSRRFSRCSQESLRKVFMFLKISLLSPTSSACHLAPNPALFFFMLVIFQNFISESLAEPYFWYIEIKVWRPPVENVTKQEAEILKLDTGNGRLLRASPTCFNELFWDPQERKYFVLNKNYVHYGAFFGTLLKFSSLLTSQLPILRKNVYFEIIEGNP